jgi:hypothetical protein
LSRALYADAVAPILASRFAGLVYSAGLLGSGSEVLGFDTQRSTDHWWGPRLSIFLRQADHTPGLADQIRTTLANHLPFAVRGFPTNMLEVDPTTHTVFMHYSERRPLNHMVYVTTAHQFFLDYLGLEPLDRTLTPVDWLLTPTQRLRTLTSGGVWHDGTGELERARTILRWYPRDVWLYVMAAQWRRIEQEEPFPGRCSETGDELGSRVLAARLVREVMHLAFLLERQYMPYSKWLGTAFARLECAPMLQPALLGALAATDWPAREAHLTTAYETLARMHNALGLTPPVPDSVSTFHGRPYQVIHGDRFAAALQAAIADPDVKRLPPLIGNTTQWADSTDVLTSQRRLERLRPFYADARDVSA